MKNLREADLYEPVRKWFESALAHRYPRCRVKAYDTSRARLSSFISQLGLQASFPECGVWDIKVDVTALITGKQNRVAFVECKTNLVTLRDVGQLLGYSLVAKPVAAILLSTEPPSDTLRSLLAVYGRYDILVYDHENGSQMLVARWDLSRGGIIHGETLPPGGKV